MPTPADPLGRKGPLSAITGVAALGGLLFGYDTGVISGGLLFVDKEFGLSPLTEGVVVSVLLVGAAISAATAGRLADRHGRRALLLEAALVFGIGALLAAFAPNIVILALARFVLGLGVGAASTIVPLYIAEIAPPRVRGALVTANQLMITVGILVSYVVGYTLADLEAWRWMFGLALIPAVALGVGMLFLPDTPRFLAKRGRMDLAHDVLHRVRGTDARAELDEIVTTLEQERTQAGGLRQLADRTLRPLLVIGVGISIFSQIAGINTIIYFAPSVLVSAGMGESASILAQVGIGSVNVLMTVVAILLVDKLGRRPLVITAFSGMAASMLVLGLIYLLPQGTLSTPLLIACMTLYIVFFAFGLGTTVWIVMSEIFPLRVRGVAVGVATMAQWAVNFVVSLLFPTLLDTIGNTFTFWLFGLICLCALWFVTTKVPETKGKSLEQIEIELQIARPT